MYLVSTLVWMLLFGFLIIPLWFGIKGLIRYLTTEYVIDDKKVIAKSGLLSTTVEEMRFNKIESVAVLKPFWGKIFGYANVAVNGTGGKSVVIANVQDANTYKNMLDEKIDN